VVIARLHAQVSAALSPPPRPLAANFSGNNCWVREKLIGRALVDQDMPGKGLASHELVASCSRQVSLSGPR